jgi:hypothetical protein
MTASSSLASIKRHVRRVRPPGCGGHANCLNAFVIDICTAIGASDSWMMPGDGRPGGGVGSAAQAGGPVHDDGAGHGHREDRSYLMVRNVESIRDRSRSRKVTTVGIFNSERTTNDQTSAEARYFIGSRRLGARR